MSALFWNKRHDRRSRRQSRAGRASLCRRGRHLQGEPLENRVLLANDFPYSELVGEFFCRREPRSTGRIRGCEVRKGGGIFR